MPIADNVLVEARGSAARSAAPDGSIRPAADDDVGDGPDRPARCRSAGDLRPLAATRAFRAAPDALIAATVRVWHAPPFNLRLVRAVGPHPLDGGALVFRVPAYRAGVDGSGFGMLPYSMMRLGIRELTWTMRRDSAGSLACTVTADRTVADRHSRRSAVFQGLGLGVTGLALGTASAWEAGWRAAGLTGLLTALLLLAVGRWLLPRAFVHALRRVEHQLAGLLAEVSVFLRIQAVLDGLPPPR